MGCGNGRDLAVRDGNRISSGAGARDQNRKEPGGLGVEGKNSPFAKRV